MAVNVSGSDNSLKYIAELEIDGWQKNSAKMEASIRAAAKAGAEGSERQIQANEKLKTSISDSVKEVEAYKKSVIGLAGTRVADSGVGEYIRLLEKDLKAGTITAKEYEAELARIATTKPIGADGAHYIAEQTGLLEKQRSKLEDLRLSQEKATKTTDLRNYNVKIEEITTSIRRLTNVGKTGFDELGDKITRSTERPIGAYNRLIAAAKMYKNMAATSTNPDIIAKYNRKLQETELQITRTGNIGKAGFDKLGNAIKGTQNPINKAFSGLTKMAYLIPGIGLAGIVAFAVGPILEYIKNLDLLGKKIGDAVRMRKVLSDATLKGNQDSQSEITSLRIQYRAITDGNIPLSQRKKIYSDIQKDYPKYFANLSFEAAQADKTSEAYNLLTGAIMATARAKAYSDKITENSIRSLSNDEKVAELEAKNLKNKQKLEDAKKINNASIGQAGSGEGGNVYSQSREADALRSVAIVQKEINNLKTDSKILNEQNLALEKKALGEIQKGASLNKPVGGKAAIADKVDATVNAAAKLQQKVADLQAEFGRKTLTKDEAELQALRDKFVKIANEVARFNADPKNKIKVTTDGLDIVRDAAIEDLTFRQSTEKLKLKLDIDKKLYQNFEQYKSDFGQEKAKERFGKELDANKTYLQTLQEEYKTTYDKGINEGTTGAVKDRLTELQKLIDAEVKSEQSKNDKLLLQYLSYESERKNIVEQALTTAADLRDQGRDQEAEQAIRDAEKRLTTLDESNVKELNSYKLLFDGITHLSRRKTEELVEQLQLELNARIAAGTITVEAAKKVQNEIDKVRGGLKTGLSDDLLAAANALSFIASGLSEIDANFGNILNTVAKVVGSFGELQRQKAAYEKEGASKFDKVLAGAGMVGAAIGIASSVFGYFKGLKEAAKEARKEVAEFYQVSDAGERQYQALLRGRAREQAKNHAVTLSQIKEEQALLLGQGSDISGKVSSLLSKLQREQYISSTTYRSGTWFRKAKTTQNMGSLSGKSFDDIEQLALQGKLTEGAKKLYDELVKLKAEGVDVEDALLDVGRAAAELATGTNIDSLSDRIISSLKDGKNGLEDVMNDYADIIQNALLSTFESEVVKKELAAFYAKLTAAAESDGMITQEEKEALSKEYIDMRERIRREAENYSSVTGASFTDPLKKDSASNLSGAIKGITESQADLLAGQFGGLRLTAAAQLNIASKSLEVHEKNEQNTRRLHEVVPILKAIQTAAEKGNNNPLAANGKG